MRVLVCGGRNYNDKEYLYEVLNALEGVTAIVHGAARGADTLAGEWAKEKNIPIEVFPADWNKYGKSAGYIRNMEMAETLPDLVIAFPGGAGTLNMIKIATNKGLNVTVIGHDDKTQKK